MKRSLFTLALAGAGLAAPAYALKPTLDLNIYGAVSQRYLSSTDYEPAEDQFEPVNNGSNANLTAALKGEKFRIFATLERGVSNDKLGIEQIRQVFGGVQSPIGSITLGKTASEYRNIGQRIDPFYDTAIAGFNGRAYGEGGSYGFSNLNNGFSRNVVNVKSPMLFDRLQINAGAHINDKNTPNDKTDYTGGLALTQKLGEDGSQFTAAVQYLQIKNTTAWAGGNRSRNELLATAGSPGRSISTHLATSLTTPKYSLGLNYENVDVAGEVRARHYWALSSTYAITPETRVAAEFGLLDFPRKPAIEGKGYAVGVFHKVNSLVNAYAAVRQTTLETGTIDDVITYAVGLSMNLNLNLFPFKTGGGE